MGNQEKHIALYFRSATGNVADISRQTRLLSEIEKEKKFVLPSRVYADQCQSGLHPGPEFLKMCRDIEDGKVGVVMVARLDRISRRLDILSDFYQLIERTHCRFLSAEENLEYGLFPDVCEVACENN